MFIWLPLLLLAMEKSIQQRKSGLLILTITLVLINNFYFAYYFLIIASVYGLIRIMFRHPDDDSTRIRTLCTLLIPAVLALEIAYLFSFTAYKVS